MCLELGEVSILNNFLDGCSWFGIGELLLKLEEIFIKVLEVMKPADELKSS